MEDRVARVYRFKKVLKYSILSLIITILGLLIFDYFRIKPNNVYFTNISSNSVTVSWDTKIKTDATAIYVEPENKIPFLILPIFKDRFFDTRDITKAELEAAQESSQNQEGLEVTMNEMVTNVSVTDRGRYYTHHVEIKGLEPEKEYSFMVGDSIVFRKVKDVNDETVAKTYAIPDSISTPSPIYGSVKNANNQNKYIEDLELVQDGILYANYIDKTTGMKSNIFSSSLNNDGNWYIDLSNAIDNEQNLFMATYNQFESDVYLELTLNAGPLGKWRELNDLTYTAPMDPFIINIENSNGNEEIPGSIFRIDSLLKPLIKNVYAEWGCPEGSKQEIVWDYWCGPCSQRCMPDGKWLADADCDMGTLGSRGCNLPDDNAIPTDEYEAYKDGQKDLECVGGEKIGEIVLVSGVCKECILYSGYAKYTDSNRCQNGEVIEDQKEANCESNGLGTWNGASCICDAHATLDGRLGECKCSDGYTPKRGSCIPADDRELFSNLPRASGVTVNPNINNGEPCKDDSNNIFLGIWDSSKGVCNRITTTDEIDVDEIDCYDISITDELVYYDENGERRICGLNNQFHEARDIHGDTACVEGGACSRLNTHCTSPVHGKLLRCDIDPGFNISEGGVVLGRWTDEDIAYNSFGVGTTKPEVINKTSKCNASKCFCLTIGFLVINKDDICPEIPSCNNQGDKNKVCNKDGNTCKLHKEGVNNKYRCDGPINAQTKNSIYSPSKLFAQEDTTFITEKYIIDQSTGMISGIEEGMYTFEVDGVTHLFIVTEGNLEKQNGNILIFIDKNENGTYEEDIDTKVSDLASEIMISTIKKSYNYSLKKGFNFISFPFISVDNTAKTASGMLKMLNDLSNGSIYSISQFDGSWKIVGQNKEKYDNNDFQIIPGKGYVIKSTRNVEITISGYPVKYESVEDSAPVTLMPGWNLIGIYGSNVKSYTAKSMLQDINAFEPVDFTADNVSTWESDIQRYEGFQLEVDSGVEMEYGFDYAIDILKSYFVKVDSGEGNWQPKLAE